jgi:menaquinone-dependent protoporphyrinogen IX oxidase
MKGAVIYHSKWGNCKEVAENIAAGLAESGFVVSLFDVDSSGALESGLEFIVAGAPTRVGKATGAMRKFIKRKVGKECVGKPYAAFGTGIPGKGEGPDPKGADQIDELLRDKGLLPLAPPFKALVTGMKGPLEEGEAERARQHGRDLAAALIPK